MKGMKGLTILSSAAAVIIIHKLIQPTNFTSNDLLSASTQRLGQQSKFFKDISDEIPKILHTMVLGSNPEEHMNQAAEFHEEYIRSTYPEFVVKVWRDEDAEQLIQEQKDEGISSAWEAIKRASMPGRNAKMADFMRVLIMYTIGGVYLDVDMVPCSDLEVFVNEPGIISFPFTLNGGIEINGAGMSSPKGHKLFKMALDECVEKGDNLTTLHNLGACGPATMAIVVDRYIEETLGRDNLSPDIPHFSNEEYNNYLVEGDLVRKENKWTYVADIRYMEYGLGIYHMHFGSWIAAFVHGEHHNLPCIQHPELLKPFMYSMCANNRAAHLENCGVQARDVQD